MRRLCLRRVHAEDLLQLLGHPSGFVIESANSSWLDLTPRLALSPSARRAGVVGVRRPPPPEVAAVEGRPPDPSDLAAGATAAEQNPAEADVLLMVARAAVVRFRNRYSEEGRPCLALARPARLAAPRVSAALPP